HQHDRGETETAVVTDSEVDTRNSFFLEYRLLVLLERRRCLVCRLAEFGRQRFCQRHQIVGRSALTGVEPPSGTRFAVLVAADEPDLGVTFGIRMDEDFPALPHFVTDEFSPCLYV